MDLKSSFIGKIFFPPAVSWKKAAVYLLLVLCLYFLALFQTSFLARFNIFGSVFNITLLAIILINLFEPVTGGIGIPAAFVAGFLSDIFSSQLIGFQILIFILVAVFIKFIFKRYVRIPHFPRT